VVLPHVSLWLQLVISNVDSDEDDDVTDGNDEEVITLDDTTVYIFVETVTRKFFELILSHLKVSSLD
jgi:hypothetical protein